MTFGDIKYISTHTYRLNTVSYIIHSIHQTTLVRNWWVGGLNNVLMHYITVSMGFEALVLNMSITILYNFTPLHSTAFQIQYQISDF